MTNTEINRRIDQICANVTRAEILNSLHACRPGHPWNIPGVNHFANASMMIAGGRTGATWSDLDWVAKMAKEFDTV